MAYHHYFLLGAAQKGDSVETLETPLSQALEYDSRLISLLFRSFTVITDLRLSTLLILHVAIKTAPERRLSSG